MSRLSDKLPSLCATLLMAIIVSLPVYSLTAAVGQADAAREETILRVGFMQQVDDLNPNVGLSDAAYVFYGLVYDTTHTVENDFDLIGNLATSWWIVPESDPELQASGEPYGSVWEYNISTDTRWHDGEWLTVDDVVWTINLNADNYDYMWAYQPYAYFMNYAEAVDEDTVRVHYYDRATGEPMAASYAYLLCIPILPKHLLGDWTANYIGFTWTGVFTEEQSPGLPIVGTGPFMATEYIWDEYTEGDHITLVRNPNYHWMAERGLNVSFDKIVMYFYDDASGMATALRNGQLDLAQFPPSTYKEIKADVISGELLNVDYYDGIKCTQYWTEIGINANVAGPGRTRLDPAVRQAMALATDKEYIKNTYYQGFADIGTTLISPVNTEWHYEPTADEIFDLDFAAGRELLDEAGYLFPVEGEFRVVTEGSLADVNNWANVGDELTYDMLIRREYPEELLIANYLSQVWKAELGLNLVPRVVDEVTLSSEVYQYEYDMMIWYWSADADPNYMLFCQTGMAIDGWNDNYYDSPAYNENFTKSVQELNMTQRKVYTDMCQRVNYLDAYYNILAYPHQTYAWRTDTFTGWGDWEANPCMSFDHFWTGPQLMFQLVPVTASDDDDDEPTNGGDDDAWILYAVAGAAIIVLVIVAALMLMKKGKKGGAAKQDAKEAKPSDDKGPLGE